MRSPLLTLLKTGLVTREIEEELPPCSSGLPRVTTEPCEGEGCSRCAGVCPTGAITLVQKAVFLDRGLCVGCSECLTACPTGTLEADRSTQTAARTRDELLLSNAAHKAAGATGSSLIKRSLHVREVSTGDSASDQEVSASTNAVFDIARFGIHFVASPRSADALLVTGPVGLAMQEPLRRCYEAMADPRLVVACGTSAISGGLFRGGYAEANGVDSVLPVDCYIPGDPPHPWSIIRGLRMLMR